MRLMMLIVLGLLPLGCDDSEPEVLPRELSGEIDTDTFTVAVGETVSVVGDLTIRATGAVTIDGTLACGAESTGFGITIEAEGDIVVNGSVRACDGAPGENGGQVVIRSTGGNVTLGEASELTSGNGGDGIEDRTTGGRGAHGGDVELHAPAGTLSVADGSTIYIGNGGTGLSIEMNHDGLPEESYEIELENGGGNSGYFEMEASNIEGIEYQDRVAEEDYPPETDDPIIRAGESYRVIMAEDHFEGGIGGDAGEFRLDEDVETPVGREAVSWVVPEEKDDDHQVSVRGDEGGWGREVGGSGETVFLRGRSGRTPGENGQIAAAEGGRGGKCMKTTVWRAMLMLSDTCRTGNGGSATAHGGNGAPSDGLDTLPGNGGSASADGGEPGAYFWEEDWLVESCGQYGNASAYGGNGGDGFGSCDSIVVLPMDVSARAV